MHPTSMTNAVRETHRTVNPHKLATRGGTDKGHQCHLSCALNSNRQRALMLCARARAATRQNLAALGHESLQTLQVFVVYRTDLVYTKNADFTAPAELAALGGSATIFFSHGSPLQYVD
jgi:hypothetical protein